MAQSVLYADLRFTKGLGGYGTVSQVLEAGESHGNPTPPHMASIITSLLPDLPPTASTDDTDSPYENVVPGSAPTGTAGKETQHSPDWQVTRQLRNMSLEQDNERNRFSQEAQAWEQSLDQRQQELARVQEELQQAWQEGNSSQQELARSEAKLLHVTGALNVTQKELQDVQGELSAIKQAVSSLHVCLNADCCPPGWLLYRGKCLFISVVKKNWWDSYWDCKGKSSLLLVQGGWESWMLPVGMGAADPHRVLPPPAATTLLHGLLGTQLVPALLATGNGAGTQ
ncbi:CD209 antigen-like isoform X4 [Cyrtonyx montezumae]|uniref:CD209 antigen-like isoform X4 n=1 Tax=Cyrtonyx montezumae TaxID=9017 RepID=UPI0032DA7C98